MLATVPLPGGVSSARSRRSRSLRKGEGTSTPRAARGGPNVRRGLDTSASDDARQHRAHETTRGRRAPTELEAEWDQYRKEERKLETGVQTPPQAPAAGRRQQ